jgi:sugar O-acyltransferase (sialic acid O-acetyltransferase NeuD family)
MDRLVIVGSGGHACSVLDVAYGSGQFALVGLIDDFLPPGAERFGLPVLGSREKLAGIFGASEADAVFVAIGDNFARCSMARWIEAAVPAVRFATLVHPAAVVGRDVVIGRGTVLMPGAIVIAGSVIGEGCILNTACSLDHESSMGDWSSLAPGVVTGGGVTIGARSHIGLGANVVQQVAVGDDTVIGAGSLVLNDVEAAVVAYGSPCRTIRGRAPEEPYY